MAQKRPNLVQNMHFWSFWAKYCHFLHILSNARPKTNVNKVPGWVFRYVGYKTFDFSSKKRVFCPKTTKFGPKLAFLVNLGQAKQAYSMPCCGSVGGCGARAVSRTTPIYFIIYKTTPRFEDFFDEIFFGKIVQLDNSEWRPVHWSMLLRLSTFCLSHQPSTSFHHPPDIHCSAL